MVDRVDEMLYIHGLMEGLTESLGAESGRVSDAQGDIITIELDFRIPSEDDETDEIQ